MWKILDISQMFLVPKKKVVLHKLTDSTSSQEKKYVSNTS